MDESVKLQQHFGQMKDRESSAQYTCLNHLKIDDPVTSLDQCGVGQPDHTNSDLRGEQRVYHVPVWGGGLFVIQPKDVDAFLPPLRVCRIPGVGKVNEARLKQIGIQTVGDLRAFELDGLETLFGRYGARLYDLARGIDHSPVTPDRPTKSISAEDTFEHDIPLSETEDLIRRLAEKVWLASRRESRSARTVVLKLKTREFNIHTRSYTPPVPPTSCEELTAIALSLRERVDLGPERLFRLVGVGLGNFREFQHADSAIALPQ